MGTRPVSLQDYLGWAEEVLLVVSYRFGLQFFLKWDGFSFWSWRGPVGVPHTNRTLHRTRDSRRRYGWLGPVGDPRFCSGRGQMKHAKYSCWCMVISMGHGPTYTTGTLVVPGVIWHSRRGHARGLGAGGGTVGRMLR